MGVHRSFPRVVCCSTAVIISLAAGHVAAAQTTRDAVRIAASTLRDIRTWDAQTNRMLRDGDLRVRSRRADTMIKGRTFERADQYYKGVRVFGADVAREMDRGVLLSVFGTLYPGVAVDTVATIDADRARDIVEKQSGAVIAPTRQPELVVLPHDGVYTLTWRLPAATDSDIRQYFVDAHDGSIVLDYSQLERQVAAVGRAQGVLGDTKKISVSGASGHFTAEDRLRPPSIRTLDMKGNLSHTLDILNGSPVTASDIASDDDNNWTDGAVDDAHVYQGWTYDYYFKRFGRRGLDNHDIQITGLANPVRRSDLETSSDSVIGTFFLNAFYAGGGYMVYGVGLPAGFFTRSPIGNQTWDFVSGALDVVAHELSHGVTQYTSDLIYLDESGALNEAFSDIMGTSVEFFFQPPGTASRQADYLMGEDVVRPGGLRSLSNPAAYGDPDHYSKRFLGSEDNGGVHTNSAIASHAFYLAIEGGTNATSGLSVQGVGAANREQIEKVFYRGFTELMPANATFSVARAVTIQAARDLYGAGGNVERAVTEAWTAVGVN
jgi:bacillolysin